MKKRKKLLPIITFLLGFLFLNLLMLEEKSPSRVDFSVDNIVALKASAGELYCDQTNEKECKIEQGGATGYSTGVLKFVF